MKEKIILTDCDGVLLNWEYAFHTWLETHGHTRKVEDVGLYYDISRQYGMDRPQLWELIKTFNESAAIGFLPPLRDAVYYIKKLHEQHGYVFHVISSLSLDESAGKLRTRNLEKLFGENVWHGFTYLDTGEDKDRGLLPWKGHDLYYVEDKYENAMCAYKYGLTGILMEHGHNMHITNIPKYLNWKGIYTFLTGENE